MNLPRYIFDFETRSECDLKRSGPWAYSLHPTTEVLCCAWTWKEDPDNLVESKNFVLSYRKEIYPVFRYSQISIEAHNAAFEYAIWHNIMAPRYGWPEVVPERWYCSAALAASFGLPRGLDGATQALGLSESKDKTGHALMLKLCKPRPHWKKTGIGDKYFGTDEDFERLEQYCRQDVKAELALSLELEKWVK